MEITKTTGTRYKTSIVAKTPHPLSIINYVHFEGKGLVLQAYRGNDTFEVRLTPKETADLKSLLLRTETI